MKLCANNYGLSLVIRVKILKFNPLPTLAQVDLVLPESHPALSTELQRMSGTQETRSVVLSTKLASQVQVYAPIPSTQFYNGKSFEIRNFLSLQQPHRQ